MAQIQRLVLVDADNGIQFLYIQREDDGWMSLMFDGEGKLC